VLAIDYGDVFAACCECPKTFTRHALENDPCVVAAGAAKPDGCAPTGPEQCDPIGCAACAPVLATCADNGTCSGPP
jgi:hypothetical protein